MRSWWIDEPRLLGTSNPTTAQLRIWYDQGFRTVISFLEEDTDAPNYDVDKVLKMGYTRYNIPVEDFAVPAVEQFRKFVKVVDESLQRGAVVIHCFGGVGRTGAMAAAYWIGQGLTADQAIDRVLRVNPGMVENRSTPSRLAEFEKSR